MDKLSSSLPQFLLSMANTPSRGIHFVQEHTKDSIPSLVDVSVLFSQDSLDKDIDRLTATLPDLDYTVQEISEIAELKDRWSPVMFYMMDAAFAQLDKNLKSK